MHFLCEDSRTSVLFVEDDEQLDKALEVRAQLPLLKTIVVFDMEGLSNIEDEHIISLDQLKKIGREYLKNNPNAIYHQTARDAGSFSQWLINEAKCAWFEKQYDL